MSSLRRLTLRLVTLLGLLLLVAIAFLWTPDRSVDELKARWAPAPSRFIDVAGMSVHVRDEGPRDDPSPIVFLHGTSASLHTWDGWAHELSAKRRVVRLDLQGFGLTGPAADGDYTLASDVRFVNALLAKLGIAHCVLVGNSFGGTVSILTALANPGRVDKLVLVDSGGYPLASESMPIGFRIAMTPVLNRVALKLMTRGVIEASLRDSYGDPSKITPELVDRYYEINLREGNRHALVERFRQVPHEEIEEEIGKVTIPTLIVWGGRDNLLPPAHAERFHRAIPGSRVVMFDDLGHVPQEEDPQRTVAAVKAFLAIE
jgi:pimeloyl-ACP methyl ester carboxylesterase